MNNLYLNRKLSQGYPNLDKLAFEKFTAIQEEKAPDRSLANYTERPAVNWYFFAVLCKLGRQAGFAQFYSLIDLLEIDDPSISKSNIRKFILYKLKFNPWLRALALTQIGGTIIMLKRRSV